MDREILFRGKRLDSGGWEYGYPHNGFIGTMIIDPDGIVPDGGEYGYGLDKYCLVDPATVGQYTGLCDKNGKKIFEGDEVETSCGEIGIIEYIEEDGMFIISFPITSGHSSWIATFRDLDGNEMEVIGNIHDTPDLAKEEESE